MKGELYMQHLSMQHTPEELDLFYSFKSPKKKVRFCSVDLRDGQQSLIATRMRTADMIRVIGKMDKVGFDSIEMWGGATFDVALRFLREDPFERLRLAKQAAPNTPLRMLLRGQNLVGYHQYPDDIVERFVQATAEAGLDIFLIFDGLNDARNCKTAYDSVLRSGKRAEGNLMYTISPVHTDQLYAETARQFVDMGASAIHLEDMAGMKDPVSTFLTIRALCEAVDVPIHYHSHSTGGMADICAWEAVRAGADVIDTDFSAFCNGTAHPPLESLLVALAQTPYTCNLDLDLIAEINRDLLAIKEKNREFQSKFTGVDISVLQHKIPGGMLSNLESQLKSMGAYDRLDEVLAETGRVYADFGYPPLATPFSQIVGTQATMNVLQGERYQMVPKESQVYMRGEYGRFPAPVNPEVQKKILGQDGNVITCRPADLLEPGWDKAKAEIGELARSEEDVLMYSLFPAVAREYLEERTRRLEARAQYQIERII